MTDQLNLQNVLTEEEVSTFKSKLDEILKQVVGIDDTAFIRE